MSNSDWKLWGTYGHLLNQHMGWEYLLQSWPRLPLCRLWSQDAVFALINVSLELRFVEKQRHRRNPYVQKHIPAPAAFHVYNISPSHVRVNSSRWIDFNVFSPETLSNALNTMISLSTLVLPYIHIHGCDVNTMNWPVFICLCASFWDPRS